MEMDTQRAWLGELRQRAASRKGASGVGALFLDHPSPEGDGADFSGTIAATWPDDLVVTLSLPALIADRLSIAQALLAAILRSAQGAMFVQALRRRIPSNRDGRNWLINDIGMSLQGANCVAAALSGGDFDAIATLTAESFRVSKDEDDAIHALSPIPLVEAQARLLVDLILDAADDGEVRWVVLTGIEELVGGGAPHAVTFRNGLRRWLADFLRRPRAVLLGVGWSGCAGRIDAIEPVLRRELRFGEGASEEDASMMCAFDELAVAAGLARLGRVPLVREQQPSVWRGQAEDAALILPLLDGYDDPARWTLLHVAPLLDRTPVRCVALVPVWALGNTHANSRNSLMRAYPHLRWVPLSLCETCCLVALGRDLDRDLHLDPSAREQPALAALDRRLSAAWSRRPVTSTAD